MPEKGDLQIGILRTKIIRHLRGIVYNRLTFFIVKPTEVFLFFYAFAMSALVIASGDVAVFR